MAESIGWATLSVIPSMKGALGGFDREVSAAMASSGASAGRSFTESLKKAAPVMAVVAVTAAIAATAVESLKAGIKFQAATTLLVTGAGESEKSLEMVRKGLLAMAPAVGIGPEALAKAMFLVESAGYHGAAGLVVMKAAAEGAKIGGASATTVANGLTTALTDYHLPASMAAEVTSKLVATVAAGKTNMEGLAGSMSTVLPFAASLGVGLNNVLGAMATMTSEGISADTAATNLKFTMMSLANEVPKGAKALISVGLSAKEVHDALGTRGLSGTLAMVTDAVGKKFPKGSYEYTHAIAAIVGGTRGMAAALALTGANMATYQKNIKDISAAAIEAGGHVKGWALTQADLGTKIDQVKQAFSAWGTSIGMTVIPMVTKALDWFITSGVPGIQSFVDALNKDVGAVFKTLGADVAQFMSGFAMGSTLGSWGSGFAQLGSHVKTTFDAITADVSQFLSGFSQGRTELGHWGSDITQWGAVAGDAFRAINKAVGDFVQGFKDGTGAGGKLRDILLDVWNNALVPLAGFITNTALPALLSISKWIVETGVPKLGDFLKSLDDNKGKIEAVAGVITTLLLPAFIKMAVQATISGGETAVIWLMLKADAIASVVAQVAQMVIAGAKWWWMAAQATASGAATALVWLEQGVKAVAGALVVVFQLGLTAAAWVWQGLKATAAGVVTAGVWLAQQIEAGVGARQIVFQIALVSAGWVATGVKAAAAGVVSAGVWLAMNAKAVIGTIALGVQFAAVALGWTSMGTSATVAAGVMDTAWLASLGPIGLVAAALLGIVAALTWISVNTNLGAGATNGAPAPVLPGGLPSITSKDLKITKGYGFDTGGYTGGADPRTAVGFVHGDEHVIKSVSRRKFEATNPGVLDYINTNGSLPGYALGGIVGGVANFIDQVPAKILSLLAAILSPFTSGGGGGGGGGGNTGAGNANAAANQRAAAGMLGGYGWGPDQMSPLIKLWNQESGWNQNAYNASSGATGIPQSLPGNKMASAGMDWQTNPNTQMQWGLGYIKGRYGSPAGAWAHEVANNWYANGTDSAAPGYAWVGEHGPELVNFNGGEQVIPGEKAGGGKPIDYDRLAAAMAGVQIILDGANLARSVNFRLAPV